MRSVLFGFVFRFTLQSRSKRSHWQDFKNASSRNSAQMPIRSSLRYQKILFHVFWMVELCGKKALTSDFGTNKQHLKAQVFTLWRVCVGQENLTSYLSAGQNSSCCFCSLQNGVPCYESGKLSTFPWGKWKYSASTKLHIWAKSSPNSIRQRSAETLWAKTLCRPQFFSFVGAKRNFRSGFPRIIQLFRRKGMLHYVLVAFRFPQQQRQTESLLCRSS